MTRLTDGSGLLDPYHYERDGLEGDFPPLSDWWEWYRDMALYTHRRRNAPPQTGEPALPDGVTRRSQEDLSAS